MLARADGVQLFDRSGRIVRPTDVGEAYLRQVRWPLDELEVGGRAIRDVQDLSSGCVSALPHRSRFTCPHR
jgi:DNA-binding transcriptional LysR family regulator